LVWYLKPLCITLLIQHDKLADLPGLYHKVVFMDHQTFRTYCLSKAHSTADFPFDATTECFRVHGKIFAICNASETPLRTNLKCDPDLASDLRQNHPEIIPGFHMNKKHWNTVDLTGSLSEDKLYWLIDHSYQRVLESKKSR